MKIKYYGHACFSLEYNNFTLLFDPFITPNPLAKGIKLEDIKPTHLLLSHAHEDHVYDVPHFLKANTQIPLISNAEIAGYYASKFGHKQTHGMNIGGKFRFDFGELYYTYALHSSGFADGSYGGNPGGFLLKTTDFTLFYSGDTGLSREFELLKKHDIDLAILPIGDNFTMGPDDALACASFLGCKDVVGVHYNTFPPIEIDTDDARQKFEAAGYNLRLPQIGSTIQL